jgi:hypothetical protein
MRERCDKLTSPGQGERVQPEQLQMFGQVVPQYQGHVTRHALYRAWEAMLTRCQNEKSSNYKNYGGRGVYVAEEFRSSRTFISWAQANGYAPGLEIDRIDNDGPYSPQNCRFVTKSQNQRNKRETVRDANGVAVADRLEKQGLNRDAIKKRLRRGWSIERALTEPVRNQARKTD